MRVPIFQLDAFASRRFTGNPAAVMLLPHFMDDAVLQAIAAENNLSETAFLVREGEEYRLRWFTPAVEVPLCGHATLASAAVVMKRLEPGRRSVVFKTASGPLPVRRTSNGYCMNFPARSSEKIATPITFSEILGAVPAEVHINPFNYLVVLNDERAVRALTPDLVAIATLDRPGVIVTARGERQYDFVSRNFAPAKGISEDPVTGAAHCVLAPYWAEKLHKQNFLAYQASRRGGEVRCRLLGDRVELEGSCVFYLEGEAELQCD